MGRSWTTRPTPDWKWEHAFKLEPKGHRIFRDARNDFRAPELRDWAIADDSGSYPHSTDDGVLWLDPTRPIRVSVGSRQLRAGASLPVRKESDPDCSDYRVTVGVEAFLTIRKTFPAWAVELAGDAATLLAALSLPAPPSLHQDLVDLVDAANGAHLRRVLAKYEATGDHDHGRGQILPGGPCGHGNDCWVKRARASLEAIEALGHPT